MPITYHQGDIFEDTVDALVCPVNCVGVMGKGLALGFKRVYPWFFTRYRNDTIQIGDTPIYKGPMGRERWGKIVAFPTKLHWRNPSRLEWIDRGLVDLRRRLLIRVPSNPINSIAVPALGCGLGGLDWSDVKPLIEKHLAIEGVEVRVYEPKLETAP